jgi:hypothetical protein
MMPVMPERLEPKMAYTWFVRSLRVFLIVLGFTSSARAVDFSVGVGYLGAAGIGAQVTASNLVTQGVGVQLRAGLGIPLPGVSQSPNGAMELNALLELEIVGGFTGRLAFGIGLDFRAVWLLQGRIGLEYRLSVLPEPFDRLSVFFEFGVTYRYPTPGEVVVLDRNAYTIATGLTFRL